MPGDFWWWCLSWWDAPQVCWLCCNWFYSPLLLGNSIAKTLYYLLLEWLLLRISEWLAPWELDCAVGIVDIHGFEVAFPILLIFSGLQVHVLILLSHCQKWRGIRWVGLVLFVLFFCLFVFQKGDSNCTMSCRCLCSGGYFFFRGSREVLLQGVI